MAHAESRRSPESAATHAAEAHLADRKARTGKWWRRGIAGFATAAVMFAAAIGTAFVVPPVSLALFITSLGATAYGAVSAAIGTGSGISNVLSKA